MKSKGESAREKKNRVNKRIGLSYSQIQGEEGVDSERHVINPISKRL